MLSVICDCRPYDLYILGIKHPQKNPQRIASHVGLPAHKVKKQKSLPNQSTMLPLRYHFCLIIKIKNWHFVATEHHRKQRNRFKKQHVLTVHLLICSNLLHICKNWSNSNKALIAEMCVSWDFGQFQFLKRWIISNQAVWDKKAGGVPQGQEKSWLTPPRQNNHTTQTFSFWLALDVTSSFSIQQPSGWNSSEFSA